MKLVNLNSGDCKIMYFGKQNLRKIKQDSNTKGPKQAREYGGGEIFWRNKTQIEAAVSKVNRALDGTRKKFRFFSIKLFKTLYPALKFKETL